MFNFGIKQKPRYGQGGMMDSSIFRGRSLETEYLYILKVLLSTLLNSFKENKSFSWAPTMDASFSKWQS
jgi:hypothetical protein